MFKAANNKKKRSNLINPHIFKKIKSLFLAKKNVRKIRKLFFPPKNNSLKIHVRDLQNRLGDLNSTGVFLRPFQRMVIDQI